MNIRNVNKDGNDMPVMVFRNDKDNRVIYNIGLSRKIIKDDKEEWQNGYILAQFNKDVNIANKTKVVLKNAILDFYINKDKITVPFIRVFDYEIVGNTGETATYIEIPDNEELPF